MPPRDQLQVKMEEEHDETHESDASVRGKTETLEGTPEFKGKRKVSDVWQYFVKKKEERNTHTLYDKMVRNIQIFFKECSNSYSKPSFQP